MNECQHILPRPPHCPILPAAGPWRTTPPPHPAPRTPTPTPAVATCTGACALARKRKAQALAAVLADWAGPDNRVSVVLGGSEVAPAAAPQNGAAAVTLLNLTLSGNVHYMRVRRIVWWTGATCGSSMCAQLWDDWLALCMAVAGWPHPVLSYAHHGIPVMHLYVEREPYWPKGGG